MKQVKSLMPKPTLLSAALAEQKYDTQVIAHIKCSRHDLILMLLRRISKACLLFDPIRSGLN